MSHGRLIGGIFRRDQGRARSASPSDRFGTPLPFARCHDGRRPSGPLLRRDLYILCTLSIDGDDHHLDATEPQRLARERLGIALRRHLASGGRSGPIATHGVSFVGQPIDLDGAVMAAGGRHRVEGEGTAGPTHGQSGKATRGRHIQLRGGACLPLLAAARDCGDLGAARHVRHGLRRAFMDILCTLSAYGTRCRWHEAGPACGGRPTCLWGRAERVRAHFRGGGGSGTVPL